MITKITLKDFNEYLYELPHNILKISAYAKGKATALEFNVISSELKLVGGEEINMYIDGNLHFSGKIFDFSKSFDTISIMAYDNLIYFKSKDTILIKNDSASTIIKQICSKIGVNSGEISSTGYVLPYVLYENMTYFDIVNAILDSSFQVSGVKYYMSDDNGSICLNPQKNNNRIVNIDDSVLISITDDSFLANIYNAIHVYQISTSGTVLSYYAYDNSLILQLGKIQKSVNVDRNLTVAQCNLIAQNMLLDSTQAIFCLQIEIIALFTIKIFDIIVINGERYYVVESVLTINSSKEVYLLTLEKEV
ncbi:MAG: hypothetical protein R3Y12_00185 [Clostridia bacterium]